MTVGHYSLICFGRLPIQLQNMAFIQMFAMKKTFLSGKFSQKVSTGEELCDDQLCLKDFKIDFTEVLPTNCSMCKRVWLYHRAPTVNLRPSHTSKQVGRYGEGLAGRHERRVWETCRHCDLSVKCVSGGQ